MAMGSPDYALVVGLRNSHNKTFPVGLVAGATVFVCDNLSFSGEVRLTRKHTVHLQRDLPQLVGRGVGKLAELWSHQRQRIDAYKNHRMRDKSAHDLVPHITLIEEAEGALRSMGLKIRNQVHSLSPDHNKCFGLSFTANSLESLS